MPHKVEECGLAWQNEAGHVGELMFLDGATDWETRLHVCSKIASHRGPCSCSTCGEQHQATLRERWWRWQTLAEAHIRVWWYDVLAATLCRWQGHDLGGGHIGSVPIVDCRRCGHSWPIGGGEDD